jgi:hypothetical protein
VEIDDHLMRLAGDLATEHSLRGYTPSISPRHNSSMLTSSAAPIAACVRRQAHRAFTWPIRSTPLSGNGFTDDRRR